MKRFLLLLFLVGCSAPYRAERGDHVDEYHGTRVPDPYRWLEEIDSAKTRRWIDEQNRVTGRHLDGLPARERIEERITELWNYEKFGVPWRKGGRILFYRNDGLQNQSVLYIQDSLEDEPRVLIDPNTLSEDGTVALRNPTVSPDGKYLAYALSKSGSDWMEWKIRDTNTGEDLDDHLIWVKFSGAEWTKDSRGFFYSRYDKPAEGAEFKGQNYFQKHYYHAVGTDQSEDVLVYERKDHKDWGFGSDVSEDGAYQVIHVWKGTAEQNLIFYKDLREEHADVVELISTWESAFHFITNEGPVFYFRTNHEAPNNRVIAIDIGSPGEENWKEIIAERKETLRSISFVGGRWIAQYLKDARSQVRIHAKDGTFERELDLPGIGTAGGFGGDRKQKDTFYSFSGFTNPDTIFRLDPATGTSTLFRKPEVMFDPDEFVTKQIFYASKDGTKIPMFIVHRKDLKLDGNNPTQLYGYGGFNISMTPRFSVTRVTWMEQGGVWAMPNLRGGGEYGKAWHEAGTKTQKQNVFDDFIAAAEWLIENKYTRPERLCIEGRSNGGLLVGACMTQRPDLYGCCLPGVGVLDMLRFEDFTIGWAWTSDYGTKKNAEQFRALLAYSPYHNTREGTEYPPTLITTADHDDRVFPAHSFKFAAALQHAHRGPNPVLIRIDTKAGHGAGKPTSKRIEEAADVMAFVMKALGMN